MGLLWALIFIVFLSFSVVTGDTNVDGTHTFIVRVQNDLKPSAYSDVEHWYSSTLRSLSSNPLDSENPTTSQRGNNKDFLHVYKTVFHGFAAKLTSQQAQELKERPEVLGVFPDRVRQIHTTRSPQFLGLAPTNPTGLLTESNSGSNVTIGILDTGIWPERRSFHDQDLDEVPSRWKGECIEGERFTKKLCNRKLIGARYFTDGYDASIGGVNDTTNIRSPRDSDGHGTHTASTAAGRYVSNASLLGFAKGVAVGIAPKARIAVYKVCWSRGCVDSDILAGFDMAVKDGVDVISLSIGGGDAPYQYDSIALGSFGAMEKGVLVSASAGNDGPEPMSLSNVAPWITTVGASTIDRKFPADLLLGNGRVITGASLYSGKPFPPKKYFPIIYGGNASSDGSGGFMAEACMADSLNPVLVRGKIVMCDRGGSPRAAKGQTVKDLGGVGVVVSNVSPQGEGLVADAHLLPGLAVTESASYVVHGYIRSSKQPRATLVFRGTQVGVKPAPVVASFSSRGPNPESPTVLKPDLIAPGVNILAAWPDGVSPTELSADTRRTEFNIISGTSMACPHVSGLAALLKGAHREWSPAMIRSALMTTAYMYDHQGKPLLDEQSYNTSTVWDMGAGHVDPEKAADPGLVYDLTVDDYLNFLCASNYSRSDIRLISKRAVSCSGKPRKPWNLNYPAIIVVFDVPSASKLEVVVTRTVTHVGEGASSYTVKVTNPDGAIVTVDPPKMSFLSKGQKQSYVVRISAKKVTVPRGNIESEFGRLTWTDGKHQVISPLVVSQRRHW